MEYGSVADMKKNPNNPRLIKDDGFLKLKESLESAKGKEHFEARPCIISTRTGENIIIAGNTRYQAAKDLGWKKVPIVIMDDLTEDQENEIIIRDNVSNGEWNWGTLTSEWDVKKLEEWGLDIPELEILDEEVEAIEDDYEMPDEIKTDIVLGDLIEIGEHRLLCGDSTSIDAVEKLMNGEKADMVFTDPPYGMDLDTDYSKLPSTKAEGNKKYSRVIGDDKEYDPTHVLEQFDYCNEIIMFGADYYADKLPKSGSWYVWDKRVEENFDKMIGSGFELAWSKTKHKREIARFNNTLFSGESEARDKVHPTQKPTKMIRWFFERIKGNTVVDLFLGSGSTLIACEQTKRTCYGMELDPKYCQVIVDRMKKLDTSLIIKRNGELWMN